MKKIIIYLLCSVLTTFLIINDCAAQRSRKVKRPEGFKAQIIAGMNFSQLDGDDLIGYSMLGLRAGAQINYALYAKGGLAIGLFYDEKGSSTSFSLLPRGLQENTKLRYLSIPLDFYFDSGYRPDIEKHRVRFQLGASISRLFSTYSQHRAFGDFTGMFNTFDIAPNIGLTYSISKKSGFNLRFESSITHVLEENLALEINNLRSYLFSLQYVYSL